MGEDNCTYGFDVVEDLRGVNITEEHRLQWPCELRTFWAELAPFVTFVRGLLHEGTVTIVTLGLIFNSISFFVLTRKNMRKYPANWYLTILAVYDSLSLIMNFMVGVLRGQNPHINKSFQDSEDLCKYQSVMVELFNLLSVWIIVAFTVERFMVTKFPFKMRSASDKRTKITILAVSFAVFVVSLHKIAVSGFEGDSVYGYKACKTERVIFKEIIYAYVALNTWCPTITVVVLNGIIIHCLRQNSKKRKQMAANAGSKADDKATKLLVTVSSVYVFLVLPLGIVQTSELVWNGSFSKNPGEVGYVDFMITKFKLKWTRAFFFFFYQFNFAMNFFLYVSSSSATRFRPTLKRILGMKLKPGEMTTATAARGLKSTAVAPAQSTVVNDDNAGNASPIPNANDAGTSRPNTRDADIDSEA